MSKSIFNIIGRPPGAELRGYIPNVHFDDFNTGVTENGAKFAATADLGDWLVSSDAGGSNPTIQDDVTTGAVRFNSDGDAGDRMSIQLNGLSFAIAVADRFEFQTRLSFDNTTLDAVVGMSIATVDPHASAPADAAYFRLDGDGAWDAVTTSSSVSTTTTGIGTLVAATDTSLAIVYNPDSVSIEFYIDGALVATHSTNLPTATPMSPVVCVESNGAEEPCELDLIFIDTDMS